MIPTPRSALVPQSAPVARRTIETPKYLGVMRHAQQFRPHMKSKENPGLGGVLSVTGKRQAEAVALRLAEYVVKAIHSAENAEFRNRGNELVDAVRILVAPTRVAAETAEYVARAIVKKSCPDEANTASIVRQICKSHRALCPDAERLPSQKLGQEHLIVIQVGHDPDLTRTLHDELSYNQPWPISRLATRTPLRIGEVAMLKRTINGGWEIDYVVSPGSQDEIKELQSKLKSKMDTAKVLGAFLTALGFFAGKAVIDHESTTDWYPWVAGAGLSLFAFAVAAYIVTMFLYDSLLMPTAFWPTAGKSNADARSPWNKMYRVVGTGQKPARPPSSAATVILHSMQRVWGGMFVPATFAAAVGGALIAIALAEPTGEAWLVAMGVLILLPMAVALLAAASRPDLGHSD